MQTEQLTGGQAKGEFLFQNAFNPIFAKFLDPTRQAFHLGHPERASRHT